MKRCFTMVGLLMLSSSALAEAGDKGFSLDVTVSGFFSPEVKQATIKTVDEGSSAEQQGIQVGDDIVAVDGCEIPGCSASEAKKSLQKEAGETVTLLMLKPNGEKYEANVVMQ